MVDKRTRKITLTALLLGLAAPIMFAFALFVMPPLYDLACDVLGITGRATPQQASRSAGDAAPSVDTSRLIDITFVANVSNGAPMAFEAPQPQRVRVHPGELVKAVYTARNTADVRLTAQAIHSLFPKGSTGRIKLLQCFCFQDQGFAPGETRRLPVVFVVPRDFPDYQSDLTFVYTFHAVGVGQPALDAASTGPG